MSFDLLNKIVIILIDIIAIGLTIWVYLSDRKKRTNQLFVFWMTSTIMWVSAGYLMNLFKQNSVASEWLKLAYGSIFLWFVGAYYFFTYFLEEEKKFKILNKAIPVLGIPLFFLTTFTDLIIKDINSNEWGYSPLFSIQGKIIFYGLVIIFTTFIIHQLLTRYFTLTKNRKLQVQYFLVGILIFASMNIVFNVILPLIRGNYKYYPLGNYSTIILLGFTAYAIVKRELFDIKVVLTQILVGAIAILLLIQIFLSQSTFEYAWKSGLLLLFLVFGYLLIKSVLLEMKRRKEMEDLSNQLAVANIRLDAAIKSLEKLDKAKSEFLSMASHQLRTPLSAVKGYISMIIEGSYGKIPDKAKEKLGNVFESTERLIRIVNDLLNISKIEFGRMEAEKEPAQIEDLIQSCYEEMKIQAESKGLKIIFSKPKTALPKIEVDSLKIRQVILNLIDNAIRYTAKGEIEIGVQKTNSNIRVSVRDTGDGLSEEEEKEMFMPFTRGSAGLNLFIEGAGLGLHVAKKFLDLHKGKIWVESAGKGKGSTFYVELPIK